MYALDNLDVLGHWCIGAKTGDKNFERHLHRVPRVSKDTRDLCKDDKAGERRGRYQEASDGGVPKHVVQSVSKLVAARRPRHHRGDGGPAHEESPQHYRRGRVLEGHGPGVVSATADECKCHYVILITPLFEPFSWLHNY